MSRFRIEILREASYAVLRTEGEVDEEAAYALEEECERLVEGGCGGLILNFARSPIIASRGLAVLLAFVERHAAAAPARILFCELSEVNSELVEAAGLPPSARRVATEAEAQALIDEPPRPLA
jgi:anti-anti-sigma factor